MARPGEKNEPNPLPFVLESTNRAMAIESLEDERTSLPQQIPFQVQTPAHSRPCLCDHLQCVSDFACPNGAALHRFGSR